MEQQKSKEEKSVEEIKEKSLCEMLEKSLCERLEKIKLDISNSTTPAIEIVKAARLGKTDYDFKTLEFMKRGG
jgi:hypothetical protein